MFAVTIEHDLGEVEIGVDVVVEEGAVLVGVEDLHKGRGRVAAEIHAHLVDFVEQEDGFFVPARLIIWMILPG